MVYNGFRLSFVYLTRAIQLQIYLIPRAAAYTVWPYCEHISIKPIFADVKHKGNQFHMKYFLSKKI